jgi:hypothetical protein
MAQVVQHLPNKYKVLSSNPSIVKIKCETTLVKPLMTPLAFGHNVLPPM